MMLILLLEEFVKDGNHSPEAIETILTNSHKTLIGRLWVDCFITAVIIAHMFVRAEREGDWLFKYCLKRMIPYLMIVGQCNYGRYIMWSVHEEIPEEAEEPFLTGEHVCRHKGGFWNGVTSDQFGEQTYIRFGKSKGGLVGISLSKDQVAGWILSYHICNMLSHKMDHMCDDESPEVVDKLKYT